MKPPSEIKFTILAPSEVRSAKYFSGISDSQGALGYHPSARQRRFERQNLGFQRLREVAENLDIGNSELPKVRDI